jgi:hypothetical protein
VAILLVVAVVMEAAAPSWARPPPVRSLQRLQVLAPLVVSAAAAASWVWLGRTLQHLLVWSLVVAVGCLGLVVVVFVPNAAAACWAWLVNALQHLQVVALVALVLAWVWPLTLAVKRLQAVALLVVLAAAVCWGQVQVERLVLATAVWHHQQQQQQQQEEEEEEEGLNRQCWCCTNLQQQAVVCPYSPPSPAAAPCSR